ncbi:hypothetical protein TSAR_009162 [Trichomalopsis sarcophagae]|uniref:Large ribosomal subunit protein uL22m n=1 Tax=Trichomalopsis sarcophagae TaxID=543379 RepID=A0A232ENI5_9HYME|nr:hypothetical protein TSAR_009162 [Trichomalopsis sarcophagae]
MIQNLAFRFQRLALSNKSISGVFGTLQHVQQKQCMQQNNIHISAINAEKEEETKGFLKYNKKFFPILGPNEERRPAYVCHKKSNIRYTPKKMLYVTWLVRGMTVDEAIKQLSFTLKKGAAIVKETILEAQKLAVEEHNVEFKSNLWVAESFCTKGYVIKGLRRHAKARTGEIRYTFCHYYVRLEEGKPPKDYYKLNPKSSDELLEDWKSQMRKRKVYNSL